MWFIAIVICDANPNAGMWAASPHMSLQTVDHMTPWSASQVITRVNCSFDSPLVLCWWSAESMFSTRASPPQTECAEQLTTAV